MLEKPNKDNKYLVKLYILKYISKIHYDNGLGKVNPKV